MKDNYRVLFHDIEAIDVKVDLQSLFLSKCCTLPMYAIYSQCLESIRDSEKMKDIIFDKLVNKIVEREKATILNLFKIWKR